MRRTLIVTMLALTACAPATAEPGALPQPVAPATNYDAWVTSEAADQISLVRFNGDSAWVVETRRVGSMPVEIDGPHGVAVAPDGRFVYVTLGHGVPFGWLLKMDAASGDLVGRAALGYFPATVSVTPNGEYGFVSNFNLHGDPVPSSISKVHLGTMAEVARTETCVMPHGSRINAAGTKHYSVCMMDELLVEIDVGTGEVSRRFSVERGAEGPAGEASSATPMSHASGAMTEPGCSPTWAEPAADGSSVFVTCNRAREVLEIDLASWSVVRRFQTGENPYNLGVSPNGRYLLVSLRNRTDPAVEIFELGAGEMTGRVAASTTLVHGIATTPDSRFAFVTAEGVGSEPGRVDIIDVRGAQRVASVAVAQQATGVAVLPGTNLLPSR
jgi:DNA-binding beta-propeller fold protein YncE